MRAPVSWCLGARVEREGVAGGGLVASSVGSTTDADSVDAWLDTLLASGSGGVSAQRLCDVVVSTVGGGVGTSAESPEGSFEGVTSSVSASGWSLWILAVNEKNRPSNYSIGLRSKLSFILKIRHPKRKPFLCMIPLHPQINETMNSLHEASLKIVRNCV